MASSIRQHPVLSYYVVTFAISWAGVLLVLGSPSHLVSSALDVNSPEFIAALSLTLAGPPVAGVLLTALVEGRAGFQRLALRLLKWRVPLRWYAMAVLTAPLSVSVTLLALSAGSPDFTLGYLSGGEGASLPGSTGPSVSFVLLAGIVTGVAEELGWTGFATPRLLPRHGVLGTGLIAGMLWGAWHLVSNLVGSAENAEGMPLALYMAGLLFTFLPPFRVLMVWLYARTESLLLVMLMHASLVVFWLFSTPRGITGPSLVIWYLTWGALLWIVVAAVLLLGRRTPDRAARVTK